MTYEELLNGFRSRFDWLRLSDQDIAGNDRGLLTVLMDRYINEQFIGSISSFYGRPERALELKRRFPV